MSDSLLKLLEIGTSRAPGVRLDGLPSELAALLPSAESQEQQLWLALGASALWQRAGHLAGAAAPAQPAAPPEKLPPCPATAAAMLARLLPGRPDLRLVGEWLILLRATGGRLPARMLPDLLALATRHPALRPAVSAVQGERGRWLAAFDPDWRWAQAAPQPEEWRTLWDTGTPGERRAALALWRQHDPAAARAALAESWTSEAPEQRADLLQRLQVGLGPDDEVFLDAALDDRRKEVRNAARQLLVRLPSSALVGRMRARIEPLLAIKRPLLGRTSIEVTLPDTLDKDWLRDGVGASPQYGLGEKSGWLADLLAAVDPRLWNARFDLAPADLLQAAERSEFDQALVRGWAAAPLDAGWTEALLGFWMTTGDALRNQYPNDFFDVFAQLPPHEVHAILGRLLANRRGSNEHEQRLVMLLVHAANRSATGWPAALSRAAVDRLLAELARQPALASMLGHSLAALAYVVEPTAMPALPADDATSTFIELVRLRHALAQSFQETA